MTKLKAYIETSVFNRYFEDGREHSQATKALFAKIAAGEIQGFTSDAVIDEISNAQSPKKEAMLSLVVSHKMSTLLVDARADNLADSYVKAEIVPLRFRADAIHIATAAVNGMDCIVSLNFRHINKVKTKLMTEAINKLQGYGNPEICSPEEVIYD